MTRKHIKTLTVDELLYHLFEMQRDYKVYKISLKSARYIIDELGARGVIVRPDELYERWVKVYTA